MQITIKDSLIKKMLAQHIEACMLERNPKLVQTIMADPKFQSRLARELSKSISQDTDFIEDMIYSVRIPQLSEAVRGKYSTDQ